jgi:MYXO-CTERM domain-containing protein
MRDEASWGIIAKKEDFQMDILAGFHSAVLSASDRSTRTEANTADFAAVLLLALTALAGRSRRREAEVDAAMHRAGLSADPPQLAGALRLLERHGCVKSMVPLSGGGLLLTVTGQGLGRMAGAAAELGYGAPGAADDANVTVRPRAPAVAFLR